jgi:predicted Zn-dependent peptidase
VLAPDHATQVVAIEVWYDAGSRYDPPGQSGVSKLFEQLLFAGSARLGSGEHPRLVEEAGGRLRVDLDEEVVRVGETLPSNYLSLGLWLEAERMRSLRINDSTVAQARLATLDALGQRLSNDPYTAAIMEGTLSLYDSVACPGYAHPAPGRVGSLAQLTTDQVLAFHRQHFSPNHARLVVAGDFVADSARQLVQQQFGDIPRGPDFTAPACGGEPAASPAPWTVSTRRISGPAAGIFFRVPAHDHPDLAALELAGVLIGQGAGSRLATEVQGTGAAVATQGGLLDDRRGPELFGLFAIAAPGVSTDSLASRLAATARWSTSGAVTEADLRRAKNIYRAAIVTERERPEDWARQLQHAALFHGGAGDVDRDLERVQAVTLADLQRVAGRWLDPARGLQVVVTPDSAP